MVLDPKKARKFILLPRLILSKFLMLLNGLFVFEEETKITLSNKLSDSIETLTRLITDNELSPKKLMLWIQSVPSQISIVTSQIISTRKVEEALNSQSSLEPLQKLYTNFLQHMATFVLQELSLVDRKKCENLITELIHQRDIISQLISEVLPLHLTSLGKVSLLITLTLLNLLLQRLIITQAQTVFTYGFEYLGMPDGLYLLRLLITSSWQ